MRFAEKASPKAVDDQARAKADSFDDRAENMGRRMFESQSRDCSARGRVSIGSAVALEMIQDDKTFCARFECACGFVELVIARVWCEIPLEPGNHGSGGCLPALDDRLARIDRIHVCAPHTGLVNGLCRDTQMQDVRSR